VILQPYSRLVIDCNRPFQADSSIAPMSENTPVPGNVKLPPDEIAARQREIFSPITKRSRKELDRRSARRSFPPFWSRMHSFTPVYKGGVAFPGMRACSTIATRAFAAFILRCCANRTN
jgi:predicted N-formylglutamate amidohydrolase